MAKRYNPASLKITLSLSLCVFLSALPVFAQDRSREAQDLWICPGAEIAMYSISNAAYGGALSIAYGNRVSLGFKAAWFIDGDREVNTLELNLLFRWYFLRPISGLFIQFNGGPAFFFQNEDLTIPSRLGAVSAGLSLGWRFLLGRYWFIEPSLRGGYPFIAGAGLSAGLHF